MKQKIESSELSNSKQRKLNNIQPFSRHHVNITSTITLDSNKSDNHRLKGASLLNALSPTNPATYVRISNHPKLEGRYKQKLNGRVFETH